MWGERYTGDIVKQKGTIAWRFENFSDLFILQKNKKACSWESTKDAVGKSFDKDTVNTKLNLKSAISAEARSRNGIILTETLTASLTKGDRDGANFKKAVGLLGSTGEDDKSIWLQTCVIFRRKGKKRQHRNL